MNATKTETVKINLELTKTEAIWLKGYVKNSVIPQEQNVDKLNRETLFNELNNAINKAGVEV